jgi:hypothetical protein
MAAIAQSALNKNNQGKANNDDGGGGSTGGLILGSNKTSEEVDAALSLIPQIFTLLQQQQNEILALKTSLVNIEALLCRQTQGDRL